MNDKLYSPTKLYHEIALIIILLMIAGAYFLITEKKQTETQTYQINLTVTHANNTNIIYVDGNQITVLNDSIQPDDNDRYIISQFYNLNGTK